MGVPAFFSWLSKKYPSIVVNAIEENRTVNGIKVSVDLTKPNPNFQEFDNFYLDMNGIIHSCAHPEDGPAPKTENEMFTLIFNHIDRLFAIVRPRKLFYMAIDGVAPRAKMNQQRSRRFRASKEATEKHEDILNTRNELKSKGISLPPSKPKEQHFDSNCITPGTPFMVRLASAFRHYIYINITRNPAWHKITVILSDAFVPGEGEHKIIDFIRRQRASPDYDPTTRHCISGPDADLIMLSLVTHEPNITLLRKDFSYLVDQPIKCELCNQIGHTFKNCKGLTSNAKNLVVSEPIKTTYLFVRMDILRNYLGRDFRLLQLPYEFDLERVIDDWVFLCFFVGNDFLPHLISLDIYEGAINRLIGIYKEVSHKTQGWLTEGGKIYLDRVEMIMKELGKVEGEIFRTRRQNDLAYQAEQLERKEKENVMKRPPKKIFNESISKKKRSFAYSDEDEPKAKIGHIEGKHLREILKDTNSLNNRTTLDSTTNDTNAIIHDENNEPEDSIRLWEDGWKDRYYRQKFGVSETDVDFRRKVAWAYTEGLCWVWRYYLEGCPSWDYYYPYHYAPFASDFDTISHYKPDWSKPTKPFNPLEQLMAVFPAGSKSHIPAGWRNLMTSPDSPILQFYPTEFKIDMYGTKFSSQGVTILPFVDEKLLLTTLESHYDTLTDEEKSRNITGSEYLFAGKRHEIFGQLQEACEKGKKNSSHDKSNKEWLKIDPRHGLTGEICYDANGHDVGTCYHIMFPCLDKYKNILTNNCIMVTYRNPLSNNS